MTQSKTILSFTSLFLLLCFSSSTIAQSFSSSCIVVDSLQETITREASALALTYTYDYQTPYTDSVHLSPIEVTKFHDAIAAVRNLETDITDSIFSYYNFYFDQHINLNLVGISVRKDEPWYIDYADGIFPTGYSAFDSMIQQYELSLFTIHNFPDGFIYDVIDFETAAHANTTYLASLLDTLRGVRFGLTGGVIGDGDYIVGDIFEDYVSLIFSIGEGDCPNGCMQRYFWEFRVFGDCSVEFIGNNSTITSTSNLDQALHEKFRIYPNPFKDKLNIETDLKDFSYQLYNLSGQLILQGKAFEREHIITDPQLQKGLYLLRVMADNRSFSKLMIRS